MAEDDGWRTVMRGSYAGATGPIVGRRGNKLRVRIRGAMGPVLSFRQGQLAPATATEIARWEKGDAPPQSGPGRGDDAGEGCAPDAR